ncbi:KedN5 family methylcobalamin-dependent radical SAM C-methyltransferase [Nonomuraea sp. NPDC050451]|uniref:KedN5 family methylcobalamin-dependent radical SAM C-methyltransferase n=1 Tax=Nonomuraea sp. NPDC050451 TaxID=3364364 RepID=UPI0037AEC469
MPDSKLSVAIVQQGVWDMPLESVPLAAGYLKASAMADENICAATKIEILNFRGKVTHTEMAFRLFRQEIPDVLAFSVFGWNFSAFSALATVYKRLNPRGLVIFGGTHVSQQAVRVFRLCSDVDIVVNGEGEMTFRELLRARTAGTWAESLPKVAGVSWRREDGAAVTNPARPPLDQLDVIPSPYLTGAIDLIDGAGQFRYDVALLETNRGCPYKCSFCYWGGAIGQRVRAFSRERLRAEIELFAKLGVHTIVACDANFGMLPIDGEFVEDLLEVKEAYGFPKAFETSWAKNKSALFYDIVRKMKDAGLKSSFTMALQSLDPEALRLMDRKNMKLNKWKDLAAWLQKEGLDCYAELIWGLPGETADSFLQGYDELSEVVSRIAVYPLMLLPNTRFSEKKEELGIISIRGDSDDFEYVLAHRHLTFDENQQMLRFLFWARVIAENAVLRHIWAPLRKLAGITQSQVLENICTWVEGSDDEAVLPLRDMARRAHGGGAPAYAAAIAYLFVDPNGTRALEKWWRAGLTPLIPAVHRPLLDEVFRYDLLTRPVCPANPGSVDTPCGPDLPIVRLNGIDRYVRAGIDLEFDVPSILAELRAGHEVSSAPKRTRIDLYYKTGALNAVLSTNHEEIMHYMGDVAAPARPARDQKFQEGD